MYFLEFNDTFSEEQQQHAHRILSVLYDLSPYDSSCECSVGKAGWNRVHAQIQIRTHDNWMHSESEAANLEAALEIIETNIRKQLASWKAGRFKEPDEDQSAWPTDMPRTERAA